MAGKHGDDGTLAASVWLPLVVLGVVVWLVGFVFETVGNYIAYPDVEVRKGEVFCLLGRNGVGKTSTLRAVAPVEGFVAFDTEVSVIAVIRRLRLAPRTYDHQRKCVSNGTAWSGGVMGVIALLPGMIPPLSGHKCSCKRQQR